MRYTVAMLDRIESYAPSGAPVVIDNCGHAHETLEGARLCRQKLATDAVGNPTLYHVGFQIRAGESEDPNELQFGEPVAQDD